jgi:DHA2 family multidrug resistance protein-like MFS transporter
VIELPCFLYSMDLTVLYLAVPKLSADLQPTSSQLLWITDVYGFLLAGLLITMGALGDRTGRRRLLMIGAVTLGEHGSDTRACLGAVRIARDASDGGLDFGGFWIGASSAALFTFPDRRASLGRTMGLAWGAAWWRGCSSR